ncbi:MAG: SOUL family heme-binding protein, partial [Cytophagales bacterium]
SIQNTETQKYEVVRTEKDFEIRHYPTVTMATIASTAKSYKELGNEGFRNLANYIFGGNAEKQQIAMTSPVHMDINDSVSTMSFVMPSQYNTDNLPTPNDSKVVIINTKDEYVAAIQFGGFASGEDIKHYSEKLKNALQGKGILYFGNFRYLGYNPPYQLFGRRNEIIVNVNFELK